MILLASKFALAEPANRPFVNRRAPVYSTGGLKIPTIIDIIQENSGMPLARLQYGRASLSHILPFFSGHRVLKLQPGGTSIGLGTFPSRRISFLCI